MCTLVVATRVWESASLVVAANRDEQLARPAAPPATWARDDEATIFAPRDLQAGGTWLGIRGVESSGATSKILFVGITNRFRGRVDAPGPRSRGELVLDALAEGDVERAAERIAGLDPSLHNPFHLVIADREAAHLVWNDGARHHHEVLAPGLHVISERSRGAAPTTRDALLQRRLRGWVDDGEPSLDDWRRLLSEHATDPLEGSCVHADDRGYGTRSSTVVRLPAGGLAFFHADGRPCVTAYEDLSAEALAGFGLTPAEVRAAR
ncbi:NRDE family protein [Paraliomyxa miuraensis]|uniref:NRDE family protein n=1 Tax=Paraliomyxa miuraensis TaxID=376150 RepID=UPI0022597439|nr:NRDE family protein [Paraliomyxa miuraensis]MCX4245216.1 NRDE family protein [Paraliomyxa miuraensis]